MNIIEIITPRPSPAWVTDSRSRKERVRHGVLVEIKMLEREGPTGRDSDVGPLNIINMPTRPRRPLVLVVMEIGKTWGSECR